MPQPAKITYTCCRCELRFLAAPDLDGKQRTEDGVLCLLCLQQEPVEMAKAKKKGPDKKVSKKAKEQAKKKADAARKVRKREPEFVPPNDGEW